MRRFERISELPNDEQEMLYQTRSSVPANETQWEFLYLVFNEIILNILNQSNILPGFFL
jgi:hypothetical protein